MLSRELAYIGHEVTFLTSLPSNRFIFPYKKELRDGVSIIAFPDIVPNFIRRTGFGPLGFLFKLFYIFFNSFDIYHSDAGHRPTGGIPVLIKKIFFSSVVYVCEWWDYFGIGGQFDEKKGIRKYTHGVYDLLFEVNEKKLADGIVCLSTAMKARAMKEGISESNICVINGGSDVRNIKYMHINKYREKYGIKSSAIVFGFIGMNVGELNDLIPFIEALNELSIENKEFSNCILATTGKLLPEKILVSLKLKFKIIEFGWVNYNYFSELLSCIDLFVLVQIPNKKNETRWPNKLGDYIAAGRKTIINLYGETAILGKAHQELFIPVLFDKESIKTKLIEIFNNGEIYADRQKIRQIAVEELSWETKSKQLDGFYSKILEQKKNKI
jgi:glycosyltransferase involved in cell wall biosynthesis